MLALAPSVMCAVFVADSEYLPNGSLAWTVFAALIVNRVVLGLLPCRGQTSDRNPGGSIRWSRTHRGPQAGIPSPVRQARRQSEFLRTLLKRHRTELVGRFPFGLRTITKICGDGNQSRFRYAPMQLFIAVSDSGRVSRLDGWKPPHKPFRVFVKKADLVPEEIKLELDQRRTANLLHFKPLS